MLRWSTINEIEYCKAPCGAILRMKDERQGSMSAGMVVALQLLTDRGWEWLDVAWFRTDRQGNNGRHVYSSRENAREAVISVAEYLYGVSDLELLGREAS